MVPGASQRVYDLRLALTACSRLLAEARSGEIAPEEWTVDELEALRTDIAAQLVAEALGLSPAYVRP